jgi:hypothetical protein
MESFKLEAFAQSSQQRTLTDAACVQKADLEAASVLDALVAISLEFNQEHVDGHISTVFMEYRNRYCRTESICKP